MKTLIFNDSTREFVLSLFDKKVDENGYIVEKDSGEKVLTPSGDDVQINNFAGFTPGSEIILTQDLPSLLQYANKQE